MAWSKVTVKAENGEWMAQQSSTASNPVFSVPYDAALNSGDSFTADGKAFIVINSVDFAQRGETLLVEAKESKNDKRTKRGEGNHSGEQDIQDETVD